ncbi:MULTISPECIES: phosphatase PAP2 family protein [Pantoea]|jgi:membrane-associated phospholipid phosphatase|uniref:Phosphatase PAP2 family protein n=1 Tax=Pantoea piersonii TaxID=2364647 RepID=A0AAJ5QKD2_9GAMM|nr:MULTISPECIES: phosphatase PAP2 family protein [Pantoea]MDU6433598.1 phosphatase PAP2 family protein [Pantoea sp.]MBZ6384981.1 phosphatase PAP2 family protein [Pantoea piersonii]MBZ6398861.1 phosphatase PAP2 family protein [Pantoea piersonii]MBZ6408473.1 phosphatase PAP2 family protein [Pantoea piersonii]MBZ6426146.1 phosphatase PAP2 family protein [Pantoea piersonii]
MHWRTLTYFGDSMLLIPTAVIIALILPWKSDNRRTVWYWLLAFGLAGLLVSLSKILFLGFGIGSARFNFTGFSGHSAMSATLWPVMLWLVSGRWPTLLRLLAIGVGYLIPLMVGFSRLVMHAHSASEVATGLLLGFTLSSAFLLSQRRTALKGFSWPQVGAAFLVPLLLMGHGRVATTQQFLERFSADLAGLEKPFTRADLFRQ